MDDFEKQPIISTSPGILDDAQYRQRRSMAIQDIVNSFSTWNMWPEAKEPLISGSSDEELHILLRSLNDIKWNDLATLTGSRQGEYVASRLVMSVRLLPLPLFTYYLPGILVALLSAEPRSRFDDGDFLSAVVFNAVSMPKEKKPLIRFDVNKMNESQRKSIAGVLLFFCDDFLSWKDRYRERLREAARYLLSPDSSG